jgi:hypothetical protein
MDFSSFQRANVEAEERRLMPRYVEKYFLNASLEMNNDRRLIEDYLPLHHGSANTINAVPRGAPYISGAYPSTQPPHPTGTPIYCLPFTL